jgi:hypothetical protein
LVLRSLAAANPVLHFPNRVFKEWIVLALWWTLATMSSPTTVQ